MLPSEAARLPLYDFVESAGSASWRPVTIAQVCQVTGLSELQAIDLLKQLQEDRFIDLRVRPGGIPQPYDKFVWGDADFFRSFDIKITALGRDDQVRLQRERNYSKDPVVFISCGLYRPKEIELGEQPVSLVDDLLRPARGYLARNQTTFEGVSENIFGALNRCSGFVAVMHQRGLIFDPEGEQEVRASVWIEQEIAIAAFLVYTLKKKIPVALYMESGIKLEGLREKILLNTTLEFSDSSEVLTHFRSLLEQRKFVID